MSKKYETSAERATRYMEELKMNCTSEKGVVRPLTSDEVEYRKGFILTVAKTGSIKSEMANGLADPREFSRISGESAAYGCMRGEQKHNKKLKEKKQLSRLKKKYPGKTRYYRGKKYRKRK